MIDTIAFEPNPSGNGTERAVELGQDTVERLTLTADRTRLRYEVTVEDPRYLTAPATLTQQWGHRPDLEFSQNLGACDRRSRAGIASTCRSKPSVRVAAARPSWWRLPTLRFDDIADALRAHPSAIEALLA